MISTRTLISVIVAGIMSALALVVLGGFVWFMVQALGVLLQLVAGGLTPPPT